MTPQYLQYWNEKLSLHDDWTFHMFYQPEKKIFKNQLEQLAPLKNTSIQNILI